MVDYDVGKAFSRIEDALIRSMMGNLDRHRAEETKEGIQWEQWQALQLKALEDYKRSNRKVFGERFSVLNGRIDEMLQGAYERGGTEQEVRILKAIQKGLPLRKTPDMATAAFFRLNQRKMDTLIKATLHDMQRAETAVLRMADDKYRKIIFNAQVYANSGAGTYEKAVDMATKDFLSAGLNCIEYKNGARHTISDYADMAVRTASKRAYLEGEGEKRREWGISTVIVNKRGNPCPLCLPFVGKVFIDDVWSGGKAKDGKYPLLSEAIAAGLYHPRCKDSHTTYFPGISTPPKDQQITEEDVEEVRQNERQEARQNYAERQEARFGRLTEYSLDADNKRLYEARRGQWESIAKPSESGIIENKISGEVSDVHAVGKINREIYSCITKDIVTDEVIITENQIEHILARHHDNEFVLKTIEEVIKNPDYIFEDKHPNTGLLVKRLNDAEHTQLVLRLCTSGDEAGYKNSVISCWKVSEKRLQNYLRNKKILYSKK